MSNLRKAGLYRGRTLLGLAQKMSLGLLILGLALLVWCFFRQYDGKLALLSKTPVPAFWNPRTQAFEGTYVLHNGRLTGEAIQPFPSCSCEVTDLPATILPLSDHIVRFSLKLNRDSSGSQTAMSVGTRDRKHDIYIPTILVREIF